MKLVVVSAALTALIATPLAAQTPGVPAAQPAPASPASTAKFNLDTPIETIVADPAGKAVIDADIPPLTTHPAYDQFKTMSLRALQPLSNGALTDEQLKKVETDLAAIK